MFYRAFSPLYYVSEIGDGNVQANVSERKKEKYLLCGVNVETISQLFEDYNESTLYVVS
jgi:hypothetical protein